MAVVNTLVASTTSFPTLPHLLNDQTEAKHLGSSNLGRLPGPDLSRGISNERPLSPPPALINEGPSFLEPDFPGHEIIFDVYPSNNPSVASAPSNLPPLYELVGDPFEEIFRQMLDGYEDQYPDLQVDLSGMDLSLLPADPRIWAEFMDYTPVQKATFDFSLANFEIASMLPVDVIANDGLWLLSHNPRSARTRLSEFPYCFVHPHSGRDIEVPMWRPI